MTKCYICGKDISVQDRVYIETDGDCDMLSMHVCREHYSIVYRVLTSMEGMMQDKPLTIPDEYAKLWT